MNDSSGSFKEEFLQTEKRHDFFWAQKYQPKALKDFICHREIAEKVVAGDVNHLIIEGLPGIGKRTMALALLREKLGHDILETKEEVLALDLESVLKSGVSLIIKIIAQVSAKHIEVNLSGSYMKGYATEVALLLIKERYNAVKWQLFLQNNHVNAKAIVFHQAEKISKNVQPQIRTFLEDLGQHMNVIFCCSDVSKLQVLRPICSAIHLPPPSAKEIAGVLNFIAKQEAIELPQTLSETMAENSRHCLRQAIRSFEATWLAGYPFKEDQSIMNGWEDELSIMAKSIIEEQSPNMLFLVRKKIITLMEHHICRDFVLSSLVSELKKHVPHCKIRLDIESLYNEYATSKQGEDFYGERELSCRAELLANGMKNCSPSSFVAVGEFVAKFMSYYKAKRVQAVSEPNRYNS